MADPLACPKCAYVRKPKDAGPLGQCPSCGVVFKDLHASDVGNVSVLKSSSLGTSSQPGVWDSGHKDTRTRQTSPGTADSTSPRQADRATRAGRASGKGARRLIIWGGAVLAVALAFAEDECERDSQRRACPDDQPSSSLAGRMTGATGACRAIRLRLQLSLIHI